ncbi:MAG: hypothetical protein K0R10_2787 [Alphaproteobacteria bacterium]|jgi:hypothetical protein|nr:hypothetical protein [Alphaproteobacteria bacterium]
MAERYRKENDYTISAIQDLPSGGLLTRQFNFASEQITTIYERKADMKDQYSSYGTGAATSVSTALSSQMAIQKFSDLDSQAEVEIMREKLLADNGKIPEASNGKPKLPAKLAS